MPCTIQVSYLISFVASPIVYFRLFYPNFHLFGNLFVIIIYILFLVCFFVLFLFFVFLNFTGICFFPTFFLSTCMFRECVCACVCLFLHCVYPCCLAPCHNNCVIKRKKSFQNHGAISVSLGLLLADSFVILFTIFIAIVCA